MLQGTFAQCVITNTHITPLVRAWQFIRTSASAAQIVYLSYIATITPHIARLRMAVAPIMTDYNQVRIRKEIRREIVQHN